MSASYDPPAAPGSPASHDTMTTPTSSCRFGTNSHHGHQRERHPHSCSLHGVQPPPLITRVHTMAAVWSVGLGAAVIFGRKGTRSHKLLGRVWVATAAMASVTTLGVYKNHDGRMRLAWGHGLAGLTLASIGAGIYHLRVKRNHAKHKMFMGGALGLAGITAIVAAQAVRERFFVATRMPNATV